MHLSANAHSYMWSLPEHLVMLVHAQAHTQQLVLKNMQHMNTSARIHARVQVFLHTIHMHALCGRAHKRHCDSSIKMCITVVYHLVRLS